MLFFPKFWALDQPLKESEELNNDLLRETMGPVKNNPELAKTPQTGGLLDLGVTENTNVDIKEGCNVEVFKEGPGTRTAWYSANVLSLEDDRAYVLFNDFSVEEGTDKLKEWVALKGEGNEAPKRRTARSVTAIGDPVWRIGDKVDSWVDDSWLEGVITEKNKKDEHGKSIYLGRGGYGAFVATLRKI